MRYAIETSGLGKRYGLGTDPVGYDTLRDAVARIVRADRRERPQFWALRDVTFSVGHGEAVGIIGRNGAGKTTLLKILARITDPTRGEARTLGRVGALLEIGTGLHPELTGRENIYLMGVILGMRKAEVRGLFDEIVEFAGVSEFLDMPVKRYSVGMRLRLGFAVAAHIQPPIVVVDEVLAVGDAPFREQCLRKLAELEGRGRTVLFVSHDLGAVSRLCPRALWLEEGQVHDDGPSSDVISAYLRASADQPLVRRLSDPAVGSAALTDVTIKDGAGRVLVSPQRDQPFIIELSFVVRERVPGLNVSVWILDESGLLVVHDVHSDQLPAPHPPEAPGVYRARVRMPGMLAAKRYVLGVWLGTEFETFFDGEVLALPVSPRPDDSELATDRPRIVQPPLEWDVVREPSPEAGSR